MLLTGFIGFSRPNVQVPQPPASVPAIVSFDPKSGQSATSHSLTNVAPGNVLVITTCTESDSTVGPVDANISSSPSLTWVKKVDAAAPSSGNAEIYTATFTVGGNITVSSDWGAAFQTSTCYNVAGVETNSSGATAVATVQGSPSVTLTTTRANSILFCVTSDWAAKDGGTRTYRNTSTERFYFRSASAFTAYHYTKDAPTIASYTQGLTAPTLQQAGTCMLELRAPGGGPDVNPPSSFVLSTGTISSSVISLNWTTSSDDIGVVGYEIYVNNVFNGSTTNTTYNVTGLTPQTNYSIYVRAKDAANNGTNSNTVTPTTGATGNVVSFAPSIIPYTDADLIAPFRGAEHWNNAVWNDSAGVRIPAGNSSGLDVYYRFAWFDIQTTNRNTFSWTVFNNQINAAITAGRRFSFGIMPLFKGFAYQNVGGATLSYPVFLHNEMQGDVANNKDWIQGGDWVPNWNSEFFLSAWEALLNATAQHINTTSFNGVPYSKVVNYVDVRGFGDFGEWHTYPWTGTEPTGRGATIPTLKRIIDSHVTAFPNNYLVNLFGIYDGGNASDMPAEISYYAGTVANNKGRFGWRRDNWGDPGTDSVLANNPYSYQGNSIRDIIMNTWQYAPVVGEPNNESTSITSNCGSMHCDLERQITLYHANSFGNGNYPSLSSQTVRNNIIAASKRAGYRLVITGGDIKADITQNTSFNINVNWQNVGIAPVYELWDVKFQLRNGSTIVWEGTSSKQLRLFLPSVGATTTTDTFNFGTTVSPGVYNLHMIIKDPVAYRNPLPIAITGRQADGSYILASGISVLIA